MNKAEAVATAFVKGLVIGSAIVNKNLITDYGFGPLGFGIYVYDKAYKPIAFYKDKEGL